MELDRREKDCALPALVERHLNERPDHVVIRECDGQERAHTWSTLHSEALLWAGALRSVGVGKGDLVLMMIPNNVDVWVTELAVANIGAVEVPTNTAYVGTWLAHVLHSTKSKVAIVEQRYLENWLPLLQDSSVETIVVTGAGPSGRQHVGSTTIVPVRDFLDGAVPVDAPVPLAAGDLASIVWTSGTTGASKGVLVPWGQWYARVYEADFMAAGAVSEESVCFQPWPVFHMGGRELFYRTAVYGGAVVTRESFSGTSWLADVKASNATWTYLIGAAADLILRTKPHPDDTDHSLEMILGAPVPRDVEAFCRRFGMRYLTAYGATEFNNPFSSSAYEITNDNAKACGKLHPQRRVRLADSEGNEAGVGEVGELWIADERNQHRIASGYLGGVNSDAWRGGWFRTGDLFRRDADDLYYFVDRKKDALRRGGENVSSFEVEAAINALPDVVESAVVAVASDIAEDEILAYVVLKEGACFDPASLLGELRASVPKFARPRYLVHAKELPKTPSQRVRKAELRSRGIPDDAFDVRSEVPTR